MSIPFLVNLPPTLYKEAKEVSLREGPPVSFLIKQGLEKVLRERKERGAGK